MNIFIRYSITPYTNAKHLVIYVFFSFNSVVKIDSFTDLLRNIFNTVIMLFIDRIKEKPLQNKKKYLLRGKAVQQRVAKFTCVRVMHVYVNVF